MPLELKKTTLDQSKQSTPKIHLHFQRRGGTVPWPEDGKIQLFINGPLGLTSMVYLWLHQHLGSVSFTSGAQSHKLPPGSLTPLGLTPDFKLLPWPELAPDGLRLVQEYFTLESKLLFVEVSGLDRIPEDDVGETFELIIEVERPPELPERLDDDIFRLHCVPVTNLFEVSADPITRDSKVYEHLIRGAGLNPLHTEVYSIDKVIGIGAQRQSRRTYEPFFSFSHIAEGSVDHAFYTLRRAPSPIDGATDTYLSVITPSDVAPDFSEEILSIELTCTNRFLPNELRLGDICKPTPRSPTLAKFSNITEVSRPTRPPIGAEMHWRLVAHLALNLHTVTNAPALKGLLHLYNLHKESDHQRSRANELRINGIRDVTTKPERRVIDRVPVRGFHTHVEVNEDGYPSLGDAFLFGCALNWFFATEVPLNSYHRLSLSVHPLGVEFTWPATTGTQPVF
jgi:type VI secretion system protein ImpG